MSDNCDLCGHLQIIKGILGEFFFSTYKKMRCLIKIPRQSSSSSIAAASVSPDQRQFCCTGTIWFDLSVYKLQELRHQPILDWCAHGSEDK